MLHSDRPRIKLEYTLTDRLIEIIGWGVLLVIWVLVISTYSNLPDTIPVHYNALGEVDGYGAKSEIWILPVVGSIVYIGITVLNKFPHIFNYLTKITDENALLQYTLATKLLRYLKLFIVFLFGYLILKTILFSTGETLAFIHSYVL